MTCVNFSGRNKRGRHAAKAESTPAFEDMKTATPGGQGGRRRLGLRPAKNGVPPAYKGNRLDEGMKVMYAHSKESTPALSAAKGIGGIFGGISA